MRKISLYITIVLITAVLYSCNEGQKPEVPVVGEREITIKASSPKDSDTKASYHYDDVPLRDGYMVWNDGDEIGLFEVVMTGFPIVPVTGPNQNTKFDIGSGSEGRRSALFSGVMDDPGNAKYVGYYPYILDADLVSIEEEVESTLYTMYSFTTPFPYNQTYIADSFTGLPALALFDSVADNGGELNGGNFTFRTLCNVLRFRVKLPLGSLDDYTLSRIEISYEVYNGSSAPSYAVPSCFTIMFPELAWQMDMTDDSMDVIWGYMDFDLFDRVEILDQLSINYEIPGGHQLTDVAGHYYHIALPPLSSSGNYEYGVIKFIMSNGMMQIVEVNLSLLEGINKIYTVPDLILNHIMDESGIFQLRDPNEVPVSGFWIPRP